MTLPDVLRHQQKFQTIADQNGGTRAAGTPGYDASAQYVYRELRKAGYYVEYQPFEFPFFQEFSPAELEQISPDPTTYDLVDDFATMTFSGSGEVTAPTQGCRRHHPAVARAGFHQRMRGR